MSKNGTKSAKRKTLAEAPSDFKAWFIELWFRLRAKNPYFFNVLAWVSGLVGLLNEFTIWIVSLGIELHPHVHIAIRWIAVTALIMSHLPTQRPVVESGQTVEPAAEQNLPFTAKKEGTQHETITKENAGDQG
jgi:hypothetical protein